MSSLRKLGCLEVSGTARKLGLAQKETTQWHSTVAVNQAPSNNVSSQSHKKALRSATGEWRRESWQKFFDIGGRLGADWWRECPSPRPPAEHMLEIWL